jgi:hypothetical protein
MRIDSTRVENALSCVGLVGTLTTRKTRRNLFEIYTNINNSAIQAIINVQSSLLARLAYLASSAIDRINL